MGLKEVIMRLKSKKPKPTILENQIHEHDVNMHPFGEPPMGWMPHDKITNLISIRNAEILEANANT